MDEITISNKSGISVKILTYGGIIKEINVPDRNGKFENIVLFHENNFNYKNDDFFLGAIIGRYANRISNGRFCLNNKTIKLNQNEKTNHLHGGENGFHKKNWEIIDYDNLKKNYVKILMKSKNLDSGYPGNLNCIVKYSIVDDNQFKIEFFANSDMDTIFNPTSHSYFNLNPSNYSILSHKLKINSKQYLPINDKYLPFSGFENVLNTPFDFLTLKEIGKHINNGNRQLKIAKGYDHCYALNEDSSVAAELSDEMSGRKLSISTDQPGIQFYSGNHLSGMFNKNQGLCLETQHFPDSPNNDDFPSTILRANEEFYSFTNYKFTNF